MFLVTFQLCGSFLIDKLFSEKHVFMFKCSYSFTGRDINRSDSDRTGIYNQVYNSTTLVTLKTVQMLLHYNFFIV